jgi:hypothetical protein
MDGEIVETLTGDREKAFVTMEFRVSGKQVQLQKFVLRLGEADSTARFYQWEQRDPSLRVDLLQFTNGVILGSFSGWLYGTGSAAYGSQLLIRKATLHVRFE